MGTARLGSGTVVKLEAVIQGETHAIGFEPLAEKAYRVEVNGKGFEGQLEALPGGAYSLIIDGRQQEVYIGNGPGGLEVEVEGFRYPVEVVDPRKKALRRAGGAAAGKVVLKSSMPGKVVQLLVKEGASVEAGVGVIVLEAMKMQNELKAPTAGTVTRVHVADGDKVEANAPLVVIEATQQRG